jgi:uncharacterized protein YprB with RNaseH-like and TPR domain
MPPPLDLRDRLARLGYAGARGGTAEQPAPRAPAPGKLFPDVDDLIDGTHRENAHGRCFVAETEYPLDHVHAGTTLSELLDQSPEAYALMTGDERLRFMEPARTVLVDCETTGLAGGTGTYAFLIGLGYFEGGRFRVDQFFMREPSEERATLRALGEVLSRFEAVISFNGKCFDWPLIENRHVYARLPLNPQFPLHLDLLFPARRLFKRRLGSCALTDLERGVLGLPPRVGDVPGWEIPQLYFDYLRKRDGKPLVPVFEHNRADILAMLSLAVQMARHVVEPESARHGVDRYCIGRLFEEAGHFERALACFESALEQPAPGVLEPADVLGRIGGTYKRLRETERAVAIWERLVDGGARSIYPYVELAKHLEHRARQYRRAAELTERALALHGATRAWTAPGRYVAERADLEKRLVRLTRKTG